MITNPRLPYDAARPVAGKYTHSSALFFPFSWTVAHPVLYPSFSDSQNKNTPLAFAGEKREILLPFLFRTHDVDYLSALQRLG